MRDVVAEKKHRKATSMPKYSRHIIDEARGVAVAAAKKVNIPKLLARDKFVKLIFCIQ